MEKPSLLLVGNGNMGSSFIYQLRHLFEITIVSPNTKPNFECAYFSCLSELTTHQDIIVFAVKPFQIQTVIKQLNQEAYSSKTKIISLLAGAKTNFFKSNLNKNCEIYLCMSNLPVKFGKGIVAVYGPKKLSFLENLGQVIYCRTESEIDKFTSIIGSGSGFVFEILSMYEEATKKLNLGEEVDIEKLIINLFEGTMDMAKERAKTGTRIIV